MPILIETDIIGFQFDNLVSDSITALKLTVIIKRCVNHYLYNLH